METMERLIEYIIRRREELNLTQRDLAKAAGMNPGTVSSIEAGKVAKSPSLGTLEKLAQGLRVEADLLIGIVRGQQSPKDIPGVTTADQLPQPEPKPAPLPPRQYSRLAEWLLNKRAEMNVTGHEFARIARIDDGIYDDIIQGWIPQPKTLKKIALALGVDPEELYELAKPILKRKLSKEELLHEILVNHVNLPYFGQVGCGRFLELSDHHEGLRSIPRMFVEGEDLERIAIVEAQGDSMLNADIHPGNLLIARKQDHARDGQVVLANIPHVGTTCKRYQVKKDGAWLVSESPTPYPPVKVADDVRIVGIVRHKWEFKSFE